MTFRKADLLIRPNRDPLMVTQISKAYAKDRCLHGSFHLHGVIDLRLALKNENRAHAKISLTKSSYI
jgi:hypothetical protein